ncbi:hypothetical protein LX16_4534 [Stackebrandtia albiflava]|uniref:Uncharacterized protein n=1 Tax=Stackebrandtia albiflava TaxID=406432 RepID=A0A562URR9_9ACTN|nr:hypothetical protein [Stackebrandtia albiflava]TWJ08309.1 hypothetical protein LX16_4534 [Stackebrandtia albiflava]
MWDTVFQALGVLVGAVGAYYAYRQFRSTRPPAAPPSDPATVGTGDTSSFRAAQSHTREQIGAVLAGCLLGFFFLLAADFEEPVGWIPALMSGGVIAFLLWQLGPLDRFRHIELSEAGLTVHIPAPRFTPPITARFAWDQIEAFSVESTWSGPLLVLRLSSRHGLGSPDQHRAWDDRLEAFGICELTKVTPSDVALLEAIAHYSGGRHRPSPN